MRVTWLFLMLALAIAGSTPAVAAVPQLSFEAGGNILRNPSDDEFVLRSAGIEQVRLTLYHVAQPELLNQISAARATQSVTEVGLRDRVTSEAPVVWSARLVLGNSSTSSPLPIPLSVAAGNLAPGVYMLLASGEGAPAVAQWFHIGDLAVHVSALSPGNLVMTTHRSAAIPVGLARLMLLDEKGNPVREAPNDWRTDASGAVFWSGRWPDGAVLLRADDSNGNTALLPLSAVAKPASLKPRSKGIVVTPAFEGNSVPAGATAAFSVALHDDDNNVLAETLRYEFARVTHSYRWSQDTNGIWQYQTIARPTTVERGTLRPNRGQGAGQAVRLLLAVTEGRFRLTVSTPDGSMRQMLEFTAGWWRSLPVDQDDMALSAKLLDATQVQITASDRAETDAPRWVVVWRPDGPETRAGNSPVIVLPGDRVPTQPLVVGLCVPGRETAPVVCAGSVVAP